jgi:serine protease Do
MINPHQWRLRTCLSQVCGWQFSRLKSNLAATAIAAVIASSVTAVAVHSQAVPPSAAGNLTPEAAQAAPALPNFVSLVKTVKPAVVSVRVRSEASPQVLTEGGNIFPFEPFEGTPFERFFGDRQGSPNAMPRAPHRMQQALGSGFLISADGYIVTNNHVVDKASKVEVVSDDGTTYDAKVVGTDKKTDLALLKVDGRNDFPFVRFGDVKPNTGEWVVAMGNPFGLGGTVTAGIVSAQGRDIGSGPYDDYLQIDAAVNRGNSGGPTFNMNGRVIGVNTAIYSPSGGNVGIAFSVPASTAKWVVDQLKEHGSVQRSWLGVKVQAVTKSIADGLGMDTAKGVLIASTEADSPAAKAGLKSGDVIVSVNGAAVQNPRDLARKIATVAPNTAVKLEIVRGGSTQSVEATLAKMKASPNPRVASANPDETDHPGKLGITVAPAAEVDGAGDQGLAVLQVDPQGKAAEVGLAAGDVMIKAGGQQLGNVGDLNGAMAAASAKGKRNVLVLVRRGDAQRYVAVPVA